MSELPELTDARGTALALRAPAPVAPQVVAAASRVLDAVARDGEAAVLRFTAQFDGVRLAPAELYLPRAVLERARQRADPALRTAVEAAYARGEALAAQQRLALGPGRWIPAHRVALYLRRSLAPASIAALAGFARAAGVKQLVAATPPAEVGTLPGAHGASPLAMSVAAELGIGQVALAGGVQAMALLARESELVLGDAGPYGAEARRQLAAQLGWIPREGPRLALVEGEGAAAIPRGWIALALDEAAARALAPHAEPGRTFRSNRDRAVVFAQALRPSQVALFVPEPARWLGELTDAGSIQVRSFDPIVDVPLTALLRLQPVVEG